MRLGQGNFEVDRANGKLAGVCAGLADASGLDTSLVRAGFIVAAILGGPLALVAYGLLAIVGQPKRRQVASRVGRREDIAQRERDFALRMRAIETYAESANSPLAREIEALR